MSNFVFEEAAAFEEPKADTFLCSSFSYLGQNLELLGLHACGQDGKQHRTRRPIFGRKLQFDPYKW